MQSDQSICSSLEYSMTVKLLTKHDLEFLSLKGGCTGMSESTLVKIPHCWKYHVTALFTFVRRNYEPIHQIKGLHRYFEYVSSEDSG